MKIKNIFEWIIVKIIGIFILIPISMIGLFLLKIFHKEEWLVDKLKL